MYPPTPQWPARRRTVAPALAILCLLGAGLPAFALDPHRSVSQYSVRHWRGGAGFPQDPTIQAIAQTPDGYLWLGTMEGLLRFDGVRTTRFAGAKSGLPNDNIWGLTVDDAGRLWVATHGGGVVRWNRGVEETFTAAGGMGSDAVRPIVQSRDGAIWIGTSREGVSRYKDGRWMRFTRQNGLADDSVWALAPSPDGGVWVGAGGVNRCDKNGCTIVRQEHQGLPGNGVTALTVARNGDLWVGMWAGLSRLHEGRWTDWRVGDGLPGGNVRAICEDRDGNIWVGTNEGVTRLREGVFSPLLEGQGATRGYVRALLEDKEGTLWVGSVSAGLTALSDGSFLNVGHAEGLPHRNARFVVATRDGSLWTGTGTNMGLSRWRNGRAETVPGLPNPAPRSVALDPRDADALWIGLETGVARWKQGTGVQRFYTERDGLPSSPPQVLHVDRSGRLWAGTLEGLAELDEGTWRVHTAARNGLPSSSVFSIADGRDGALWAGTGAGVARRHNGNWSSSIAENAGPSSSIYVLYEDGDGVLWAGANSGLWRLADRKWTQFDTAHGYCADTVNFLVEDDLGYIWTASPKGLCRTSRTTLNAYARGETRELPARVYDRSDGIRDTGFSVGHWPKGWKAADGRLMFATSGGIVIVDPRQLHEESAPPATIEALTADNASVPLGASIALGPGRPRLELRFTALTLTMPEKLRFRYRLDGFDPEWIDSDGQRVAYYTNLPPGRYSFRVGVASSDGTFNDSGAPLSFEMRPQMWETRWFRVLALLGLCVGAVSAYSWRVRRMREQARELERRVHEGLAHIQTLKGLLPICASCKKIRDDGGYWNQIETYVSNHTEAEFSHSICPECMPKLYPEYAAARGDRTSG